MENKHIQVPALSYGHIIVQLPLMEAILQWQEGGAVASAAFPFLFMICLQVNTELPFLSAVFFFPKDSPKVIAILLKGECFKV